MDERDIILEKALFDGDDVIIRIIGIFITFFPSLFGFSLKVKLPKNIFFPFLLEKSSQQIMSHK